MCILCFRDEVYLNRQVLWNSLELEATGSVRAYLLGHLRLHMQAVRLNPKSPLTGNGR